MKKTKLKKLFSEKDEQFILNNYLSMEYAEIAKEIGCERHNIVYFLKRNCLEGTKKPVSLSADQIDFIEKNYLKMGYHELARILNLPKTSLVYQMKKMGLNGTKAKTIPDRRILSEEDKCFILDNYKFMTHEAMAKHLGYRKGRIDSFLRKNELNGYHLWNKENNDFLTTNWLNKNDCELSKITSHSESAIFAQRMKLGLLRDKEVFPVQTVNPETKRVKKSFAKRKWNQEELDFLTKNYLDNSDYDLGKCLNRTAKSVKHKRIALGFVRPHTQSNQELEISNFLNANSVSFDTQFVLGSYRYDFKINNTLVEFNGDYYHCNPLVYSSGPINSHQAYVIKKDEEKAFLAKKNDYSMIVIWEKDFKENKNEVFKTLLAVSQK